MGTVFKFFRDFSFFFKLETKASIISLIVCINIYFLKFLSFKFFFFFLYKINIFSLNIFNIFFIFKYCFLIYFFFLYFFICFTCIFFFYFLGIYGIFYINFILLICTWLNFIFWSYYIIYHNIFFFLTIGKWFNLNFFFSLYFDFILDKISILYGLLTLSIGVFVYFFSFSYFRYEPIVERFFILLNMFILSMVLLVLSGNLIVLLLGWEMIGVTSYFLINFWNLKVSTFKAAFKAFSFNKFSDCFFFFFILLIYNFFFSVDILTVLNLYKFSTNKIIIFFFFFFNYSDFILFFLIFCSFVKSAQIGFHYWLPDSMEAPVPASSLIHSATLVSAGVFLLLRFNKFFEFSYFFLVFVFFMGSLTAVFGSVVSASQTDTKRVLAYSTISHCGFLMVLVVTFMHDFFFLYLYVHGFFKAAVFMCVGNINRFSAGNQDFRRMGSYFKFLVFEFFFCFIGLINLCGLPFTFGFFIKHFLFISVEVHNLIFVVVILNSFLGAFFGLLYSFRLFYNVFISFKKWKKKLFMFDNTFKSIYFSNSNVASIIAIGLIFFFSFGVCIIYVYSFFFFSNLNMDFFFFFFLKKFHIFFNYFFFNYFFFNYFFCFFFLLVLSFKWQKKNIKNLYQFSTFTYVVFLNVFLLYF